MSIRFGAITYDCANPAAQAAFYAQVLETEPDDGATTYFSSISGVAGGLTMLFLATPERAEATGAVDTKNQVHLDLLDDAWPSGRDRIAGLGVEVVADHAEHGMVWTTFRDPEGYLFDIASPAGH